MDLDKWYTSFSIKTIFWKYTWWLFDRIIQCFKNILKCSMVKNNEASLVKNVTLFSKFYDKKTGTSISYKELLINSVHLHNIEKVETHISDFYSVYLTRIKV